MNNFGPNVLYHNNGDGTFTDVTREGRRRPRREQGRRRGLLPRYRRRWQPRSVRRPTTSSSRSRSTSPVTSTGSPTYPGPRDFPHDTNNLFHNNGDGTFTDVSERSGIAAHPGRRAWGSSAPTTTTTATPTSSSPTTSSGNFLFHNDGHGNFEEVGLAAGVAYDVDGMPHGNMGVDCADYDNDGRLDFFVTAYQRRIRRALPEPGQRHVRRRDAAWRRGPRIACATSSGDAAWWISTTTDTATLSWSAATSRTTWSLFDDTTSYMARPILLRNTGNGKFVNVSDASGDGMRVELTGRGVAFDDLDNDGRIDVVILNSRRPADDSPQ